MTGDGIAPERLAESRWSERRLAGRAKRGRMAAPPEQHHHTNSPASTEVNVPAAPSWTESMAALRHYIAARGSALVPARARADGVAVGHWAATQRKSYWGGRLQPEQVRELENLPGWTWGGAHERRWRRHFRALIRYAGGHDVADLRSGAVIDRLHLGAWADKQRSAYAVGTLPAPITALLASVPGWQWDERRDPWQRGLQAARDYASRHGGIERVDRSDPGDRALSNWLRRYAEKYEAGELSPAQAAAVETLPGWKRRDRNASWNRGLAALIGYADRHGHARPPQNEKIDGFALGLWVGRVRQQYRAGHLAVDRATAVEQLPGWTWHATEAGWQRGVDALRRHLSTSPSRQVSSTVVVDGFRLGAWVSAQRARYRDGQLPQRRIEALESIEGWTW
jgi:hypothetical protein